jgi:phage terminase large subunit GpA-like protein
MKRLPSSRPRKSGLKKRALVAAVLMHLTSSPEMAAAAATWWPVLTPPPKLTPSQWADQHRYLSPEASAEPGKWDTSRAEFQRGIMDAGADPLVDEVIVIKSAQVGWTEIVNNLVGYYIDQDPSPILVLQPTLEMAEAWSKDRFAPMVRDSPRLAVRFEAKSRDSGNTVLHKTFAGGRLTVAGANSPSSLASRPIRIVIADELGRYPASAGTEGDPLSLAYKRTNNFWNRRKFAGSTPGNAGTCAVEAKWELSDKRRFFVPCHACGVLQVLRWDQVRWDKTKAGLHRPDTARYHCEHCDAAWTDGQRGRSVKLGEWRATAPFTGIAGFHIWEAYSPWVKLADTVKAFLEARKTPEKHKTWVNTALGETWVEKGEAPDWQRLYDRREAGMKIGEPAAWAGLLVGSVDVQRAGGGRLELDVWAFGAGRKRQLVEHIEIEGSIADKATWEKLDEAVAREWLSADGRAMRLTRVGVDSGDGENTQYVYAWCRRHRGLAMALKGRESLTVGQAIAGPKRVDVTIGGKTISKGVGLWTIGTSMLKTELYGDLSLERPVDGESFPDGYVFLPADTGDEWIKQLVAEYLAITRNKRTGRLKREWQQSRPRNEALDNAVYARAIAISLGVDRWSDAKWAAAVGTSAKPRVKPKPASPQVPETSTARAASGTETRTSDGWRGDSWSAGAPSTEGWF